MNKSIFGRLSLLLIFFAGCSKNLAYKTPDGTIKEVSPEIVWDYSTLKKVSSSAAGEKYCGYARMVQLADRSLITIYEADGNVVCTKSFDLGASWSAPIVVAAQSNGINKTVPDILELQDHSLLACYNDRPYEVSPDRKFAIKTKKSEDGGLTWKEEQNVYEAGFEFKNGCWEPSAIQLPSGEIQLFFANEANYTNSDEQNISMVRSADKGSTWTKKAEIVSFRKGFRDGMPVPVLMKNGKGIAISIEDNGFENFKPYIIKNSLSENWQETVSSLSGNRSYALKEKIADGIYAGAPFLRQLNTGETILSYQSTEGRTNNIDFANMVVAVGNSDAKNFTSKSTPFKISSNKHALWNSLAVLDDNTIVALASTNAYSNNTEVWMIKGKLNHHPGIALADPTIFLDKGKYYLYGTSSGADSGFLVYQSPDLKNWSKPTGKTNGYALIKGDAFGKQGFWAPQVFKYKSNYYMSYTADEHIAIAKSNSPLGPFKQKIPKSLSGQTKQIDPFIFFDTDGKPYIYYVKLKEGNRIFVSEMKADLSDLIAGTAKECITASAPWENTEKVSWPVSEGPSVHKIDSTYYLIYSANDFRNKDYAVGYATSDSPLGPWEKFKGNPIISKEKIHLNGTGHGELFKDKYGNFKYVMHTHFSITEVAPRRTSLVNMNFKNKAGSTELMVDYNSFHVLAR